MAMSVLKTLRGILGIETVPVSHAERIVSAIGGFAGILGILLVTNLFVSGNSAALIVGSMGASAVLVFGVPQGPLSQPWSVFAGHMVSAVIGVSCAKFIPDFFIASSVAVGLAIGVMHYIRAIHPPGGATALSAVVGSTEVYDLGYQFVITPVLLNVIVILAVAVVFNSSFYWRRYPAWFQKTKAAGKEPYENISHGDLVYALSEIDSYVDISEKDLLRIYNIATKRSADAGHLHISRIKLWHFYSNGAQGNNWSVRQLVDEDDDGKAVIYKTIVGPGIRSTGHVTRTDFASWAKYEVELVDEEWQRVER